MAGVAVSVYFPVLLIMMPCAESLESTRYEAEEPPTATQLALICPRRSGIKNIALIVEGVTKDIEDATYQRRSANIPIRLGNTGGDSTVTRKTRIHCNEVSIHVRFGRQP